MHVHNAKSKTGVIYPYFICSGRRTGRTDCTLGAVLIDVIEAKIEEVYDRLLTSVDPEFRNALIGIVDTVLAVDRVEAEKARQRLDAERDKLLREQSRLLQAHYADAIPLELLKSEQERIRVALDRNEMAAQDARADVEDVERLLEQAFDLTENCAKAYREAPGHLKKIFNQVFFERILVLDDDNVKPELAEPFATITAPATRHIARAGISKTTASRNAKSGTSPKRSEEHTSELQSLMRNSYAVFCLKKKNRITQTYL